MSTGMKKTRICFGSPGFRRGAWKKETGAVIPGTERKNRLHVIPEAEGRQQGQQRKVVFC